VETGATPEDNVRSDFSLAVGYVLHAGGVFGAIYVAAALGPGWIVVPCWLWFGLLAQGVLLLLHECIHKLAFRDLRLNEVLATWLLAPFFLADFAAFRRRHWAHHRELGAAGDPKFTYRVDVRGWRLAALVLETLTLVHGLRKLRLQLDDGEPTSRALPAATIARTAVVQAGFAASVLAVAWLAHPSNWRTAVLSAGMAYAGVYLYGLTTLTVLMHTLRGVAEHQVLSDDDVVDGEAALRNFCGGVVEHWLWSPYGFVDHATHHHHPAIPAYRLPAVTARAAEADPTLVPVGSHFDVLRRAVTGREPWSSIAARQRR
jgi:fatty acid desaturase